MSDIVLPHTITSGTLADATQVQANFDELADKALNKTGDTLEGDLVTQDLEPVTDATYDLGTASKQYRNIYLSGTVIGPAGVNSFGTVAVSGQTDVAADTTNDTLTLAAGTGITITTTPASDTVTISANSNSDAGSSSVDFAGGGTIYNYQSATGTGTVGTGEDTLYSQAIAAGVLSTDGDAVEFILAGQWGANANTKRIKVKFGATTIFDLGTGYSINGYDWIIRGMVIRTSGTAQICETNFSGGILPNATNVTTAGETLSGAVTFAVTGEGTNDNDIVLQIARLIYHKDTPNN
jgi:hypothetical protein